MRLRMLPTFIVALAVTAVLLAGAWMILSPGGPALEKASFSLPAISPNASGYQNVTVISYADTLDFGFIGCRDGLPHLQRLAVYAAQALDELESALGVAE